MGGIGDRYHRLQDILSGLGSAAVAFSGGVDSTLLLRAAADALGDRALAVTAAAPFFPERELEEARDFCRAHGIAQVICPHNALELEAFRRNPPDRCYLCKRSLFERIRAIAEERGLAAVVEGSNLDDEGDYRPGLRAIEELGVRSPLREAGLTKAEVREISRELGLPTWDKPSFACLASRFVYGQPITEEGLSRVGRAEQILLDLGFRQVRVRVHGDLCRVEVLPDEIPRLLSVAGRVGRDLRALGFAYVTADLEGYRTGSMNETLNGNG